jgi:hypothetical protein
MDGAPGVAWHDVEVRRALGSDPSIVRMCSVAPRPAFSMRTMPGTPLTPAARASKARICARERTGIMCGPRLRARPRARRPRRRCQRRG